MATASATTGRVRTWLGAIAPVVLIGLLALAFITFDPIGELRSTPPIETLSFERTTLEPGSIELQVRNDGPDQVSIAQILVNDAYWRFEIGDNDLGRLESTTVEIPYPWEPELPLNIAIVTSTGLTIEHDIEAAAETPSADASTLTIYALLGLYIGVIPVAVGLLWFPALRNASKKWLGFFLAFTMGLLAFLLIDALGEGLEIAAKTGVALNGLGLLGIGAVVTVLFLIGLERWLAAKRGGSLTGLFLAYLVATGIGLHNLGEGLAVGAALAAGEVALGAALIVGFALHNTTEGLAIVAPLGSTGKRPALKHFVGFGVVAGGPTILGAWLGGFAFAPAWGSLAFGVAVGAVAQVLWTIGRNMPGDRGLSSGTGVLGFVTGLFVMYATGLLV